MSWRAGGIRPWIVQRVSAVLLVVILIVFTIKLILFSPQYFQDWQDLIGGRFWHTVIITFWIALFLHSWIGIRDVIMDYVHPDGLRFSILTIFAVFFISMTIWMFKIMILAVNL